MSVDATHREIRPVFSVLNSILTIFLGFVVIGQIAGFLIGYLFYGGSFSQWIGAFTPNLQMTEKIRLPVLVMQGCTTAIGLILSPWLYLKYFEGKKVARYFYLPDAILVSLTALLVIVFMFPNSFFIEWNYNLSLPVSLDNFVREKEALASAFTQYITTFNGFGNFLIGFLIIAILPAVGEELAFRGMLQPALFKLTGNIHAAIWISAVIFSAFHFQFLGFVPRAFLGALFGYLMYWSGNLWIPVIAHFINNGLSVIMLYMNQMGLTSIDAESTQAAPLPLILAGGIICVLLIYHLRKRFIANSEPHRIF
jgi:membrane protease YdiL (CAAX protease family)